MFELDNGTTGANAIDESTINDPDAGSPNLDDWAQNNFNNTILGLGNCPDPDGVGPLLAPNSCGYVAGPDVDPANPGGSAFRSLFISDPNGVANNDDIFTGGGSKDDLDVSQWKWTTGSAPDKDDLLPIGAAAYINGDLLIYMFGTLFAPNGSAAVGAWLFKKNIGTCADGSFGVVDDDGNCLAEQPAELHTVGDVFVVAETASGGREVLMQVFKWVGSDPVAQAACTGAAGTLESPKNSLCKVLDEEVAICGLTPNDDACGSMNLEGFPTESPDDWGFQSKFPPSAGPAKPAGTDGIDSGDFPETSLFEAGFNFSNLFPNEVGCFNSFLMNTRTSHSVRAQLKDLALGAFPLCGLEVDKTGPEKSKEGDTATYSYTITNTGAITLYRVSIIDDVIGNLTAVSDTNVTDGDCAQLAPQASCTFEVDFVIPAGADDPLVNTVEVIYNSAQDLSGDDQSATDDHSVNLFQPEISLAKTGDALSKVGDPVNYQITLSNSSSHDTPDLVCTISDPLLGINEQVTLASGANHVVNAVYVVQEGDPDPLPNTATASCSPEGFPNVLDAAASHSVELFQPSVTLDKTGDELSKAGDDVNYTITVSNTSSGDSPALECTISDALLGINEAVTLASGAGHVINAVYTVQETDPDPLPNTASVTCSPQGFPNVLEASDSHSVELFQPSIALAKTGDELSKVGDDVNYTITLSNTSSADSPDLECTVSDPLLGINAAVTLASGTDHVINALYTVQAGDSDPLPNTASATCSPIGFPNVLDASASHIVELFQPSVAIDKTANCELGVAVGEEITYSYTISNTSSSDSPALNLVSIVDDKLGDLSADATGAGCDALAAGASCNFDKVVSTSGELPGTLTNTVDVLYNPAGFPNQITASDSQDCEIVLPNPATVVIEKILQNAENLAFDYSATNLSVANFSLTPLFGALPLANSPFAAPAANEGFATTIELTVEIPDITQTEEASVTEDDPLPAFVNFVSLECAAATDGTLTGSVVVDKTATLTLGSGDFAFCRYVNAFNPGDEGCTPGFWKQEHHFGHWLPTGYLPDTELQDVFNFVGVNGQIGGLADDTMLEALNYDGGNGKLGAAKILLRAAVAAVLNAAHPDVQFSFTEGQVIALVNEQLLNGNRDSMLALATELDDANNGVLIDNGGTESCPLSGQLFLE